LEEEKLPKQLVAVVLDKYCWNTMTDRSVPMR